MPPRSLTILESTAEPRLGRPTDWRVRVNSPCPPHHSPSRIHCGASLRQAYRLEGQSDLSVPPPSLKRIKMSSHPERQVPRALAGGADHGSAPPATDWHLCAVLEISIPAFGRGETKISPGCYGTCRAVLQSVKAFGLLFSSYEIDLYLVSSRYHVCQFSSAISCTTLLFNAISAE